MRKVLIFALGLASLGAFASVRPAAAFPICRNICDQTAIDDYGNLRCYSSHKDCSSAATASIASGAGSSVTAPRPTAPPKPVGGGGTQQRNLRAN